MRATMAEGKKVGLFEYAVLLQPKLDKDGDVKEEGSVLVEPTTILASEESQAAMVASRAIPEDAMDKIERIEVIVRPF